MRERERERARERERERERDEYGSEGTQTVAKVARPTETLPIGSGDSSVRDTQGARSAGKGGKARGALVWYISRTRT